MLPLEPLQPSPLLSLELLPPLPLLEPWPPSPLLWLTARGAEDVAWGLSMRERRLAVLRTWLEASALGPPKRGLLLAMAPLGLDSAVGDHFGALSRWAVGPNAALETFAWLESDSPHVLACARTHGTSCSAPAARLRVAAADWSSVVVAAVAAGCTVAVQFEFVGAAGPAAGIAVLSPEPVGASPLVAAGTVV